MGFKLNLIFKKSTLKEKKYIAVWSSGLLSFW